MNRNQKIGIALMVIGAIMTISGIIGIFYVD